MCDPDLETTFDLFDRVVIGGPGKSFEIMLGQNTLYTYYGILFDNLSLNSFDAILSGKNQQQCCIKVQ